MFLDRLRIRGRLLTLVALPLVILVGLAFAVAADRGLQAGRASDTVATARQAGDVGRMLAELQQERLLALGYLADLVEPTELTRQAAGVLDLARVARDVVPAGQGALTAAIDAVLRLDGLRSRVLVRSTTPLEAYNGYTETIREVIDSLGLTDAVDTTSPGGRQLAALHAFIEANEANSESAALLVILTSEVDDLTVQRYAAARAVAAEAAQRYRGYAAPAGADYLERIGQAYEARVGPGFSTAFAANPREAVARLPLATLFPKLQSFDVLGRFAERTLVNEVGATVQAEAQRLRVVASLVGTLALLLPLIVVAFGLTVGAGIARPMRHLTRSAHRVARAAEAELARVSDDDSEAPEPLRLETLNIRSRDEIGELARAFERIQITAAGLVERQVMSRRNVAQMFGHIGRRTQNMVGRQLDLIDRLEYEETDPARLRELYRLDHLASRLRRSASSLVVLSGLADTGRYRAPVPLDELIRLALGEIEDYTRVDIDVSEEMLVSPSFIGDLILMLAELMENATRFSPPETRVVVGAVTAMGGGARLSIVDHGIGLTDKRLAEENARLARRERLDLAPTEVLGLFVVGRLARRHGTIVRLTHTPGGGITARLDLPPSVLVPRMRAAVPATASPSGPGSSSAPGPSSGTGSTSASGSTAARGTAVGLAPRAPVAALAVDALERVHEAIGSGLTWNAFEPPPAPPSLQPSVPLQPTGPVAPPRPADRPTGLRQRVPGAQLPMTSVAAVATGAVPASDASAVRDLVEAIEGGVRRAQDLVGRPPAAPLTRRVPGATVDPADRRARPAGEPRLDPDQALRSIQQIEHGVARALDQLRSERERDWGTGHDD